MHWRSIERGMAPDDDATLRFMFVAAVFYGLSTFEGSFLAIRPVNALSHYTDWTVGHVHSGALGWLAMVTFGAFWLGHPADLGVEWRCIRPSWLESEHFWLALAGLLTYVFALWNAGITQGLMWRTYNDVGTLNYSFIDSMGRCAPTTSPALSAGALFLAGICVGAVNIWLTVRDAAGSAGDLPLAPKRRSSRMSCSSTLQS